MASISSTFTFKYNKFLVVVTQHMYNKIKKASIKLGKWIYLTSDNGICIVHMHHAIKHLNNSFV